MGWYSLFDLDNHMSNSLNLNLDRAEQYHPLIEWLAGQLRWWGVSADDISFVSDTENIVFRVDTSGGVYCVRISSDEHRSISEISAELYWLASLKETTDVLVAQPVPLLSGEFVFEREFDGRNYCIVLFEWLSGEVVGDHLNEDTAYLIGQAMAQIHHHSATFQLPSGASREDDDWQGMEDIFVGLSDIQVARMHAFLTAEQIDLCQQGAKLAAQLIGQADASQNYGLIHSDLHAYNCMLVNGRLALIDFDDCQIAPFSCDLAITISSFDGRADKAALQHSFLTGYAAFRALPENYELEVKGFRLERRLRLLRWVAMWPDINHFPNGRYLVQASLDYLREVGIDPSA